MVFRNVIVSVAAGLLWVSTVSAEQPSQPRGEPIVQWAFEKLSRSERFRVQEVAKANGFYGGKIDGVYGAGTRSAIVQLCMRYYEDEVYSCSAEGLGHPQVIYRFFEAFEDGRFDPPAGSEVQKTSSRETLFAPMNQECGGYSEGSLTDTSLFLGGESESFTLKNPTKVRGMSDLHLFDASGEGEGMSYDAGRVMIAKGVLLDGEKEVLMVVRDGELRLFKLCR